MALRLWGVNDSANSPQYREGRTFLTKEEIENMFNGFEVIKLDEIEKDGETALGKPKHWHAFDVIVRKP